MATQHGQVVGPRKFGSDALDDVVIQGQLIRLVRQHHVTLVVHGPYRWICHPFYTFSFLMVVAVALMTGPVVWVGAAGLAFAASIF
jgi:protein-S-isoprenylcysteine O-methyltransferase Ste14